MRLQGTLTAWNDARGFGFITPAGSSTSVFVHIRGFQDRSERPRVGESLTFEVELSAEGKQRAMRVRRAGRRHAPERRNSRRRSRTGPLDYVALLVVLCFVPLVFFAIYVWHVPEWWAWVYLAMSAVSFLVYASDKSAAVAGRWRIPESTLLLLGILCGWPGAVLAQQLLRHKTRKTIFVGIFWVTVVVNVAAFIVLGAGIEYRLFA